MIRKNKGNILLLTLIFCIGIVSCDSTHFVYVDENTFQKQLSYSEEGFIEIILQIDPTKERDNKLYATPWLIKKEKKFTERTKISNDICRLILNTIKKNQRYSGEGWYPTYEIYIKYPVRNIFFIRSEKYLSVYIDFKNPHIFVSGRTFVLTESEANLFKEKLDILLTMKE